MAAPAMVLLAEGTEVCERCERVLSFAEVYVIARDQPPADVIAPVAEMLMCKPCEAREWPDG